MHRILFCLPAAVSLLCAQPKPSHNLVYTAPATVWDEALPLGNGMLGALVWGDGKPLRISLDRADLWDARRVPEFSGPDYKFRVMREWHRQGRVDDLLRVYEKPYQRPAPTKIPAGRIELEFAGGFRQATLDIGAALAVTTFTDGVKAEVFLHATEPIGMMRISGGPMPRVRLVAPPFSGAVERPASGSIDAGDLSQLGYSAPEVSNGDGWTAYSQQGAEGFRFAVYSAWKGDTAAWSISSSNDGPEPLIIAQKRVENALRRGSSDVFKSHQAWWTRFWSQSSVQVPNPVIERQWYLDTYKWGSAARRGAPPITLQAVWTADNGRLPPWKGDYHHDLNTQLSYWPAYSGNHLEDGLSYLDWLWKTRDAALEWTREFFELPGLNVPMTADINGRQIGGWRQYTHSATTGAWLAHHFYLHWRYSQDRVFLKERAYPYLRDVATFLEGFTAGKDARGKRTHPLSASPEINDNKPSAWFDETTNYDLALDRWAFQKAAELAADLGLKEDETRWRKVLSELPDFSISAGGALQIAPDYPLNVSHRHFSHLMAIHPLGIVQDERIIRASLADLQKKGTDWWCGYSYSWLGSLAARAGDGEAAAKALEIFARAFCLRNSFHANGDQTRQGFSKFTYRPFTLEGNFAMAAGLQEMLLQSHDGTVRVFPAVPESWKNAGFRTLRAEGAFLISAERRDGKTARVEIESEKGGLLKLVSPRDGTLLEVRMKPGERRVLRF
jgi:alpha-L-fucosidase 2